MFRLGAIFFFYLLFTFSSGLSAEVKYSSKDKFPVHDDMIDACEFWVKVFSEYNTNQYIIHDSREMNVIYEVVTWGVLDESKADDPFTKEQKEFFKNRTDYYEDLLTGIATVYPDTNKMNPEQRKILPKLSEFNSKKDFLQARSRIRVQRGQKDKFKRGMEISGRYMPALEAIFKKYGLPEELTALPHVESSFNYKAYSSVGAAGIWQFTRGTGKQYLKITYEVDERLDPILATEAAAKLLKRNYDALGSWPLAITAYNHGAHGMKGAVKKLGTKDLNTIINKYHSRYFKFASRNFYCEFIAALHVVQNYEAYFGKINFESPIQYKEFLLTKYLKYATLVPYLNIEEEQFRKYNPALRPSVYNNSKYMPKGYRLRLPVSISPDSLLASIPENAYYVEQKQSKYYRIRFGDTLSDIARRFDTTIDMLLALNDISDAHYIRRGMTIRLPDKSDLPVLLAIKDKNSVNPESKTVNNPTPQLLASAKMPQLSPDENIRTELISPLFAQPPDTVEALSFWQPEIPKEDTLTAANTVMYTNRKISDMEIEFINNADSGVGFIQVEPEETLGHYSEWLQTKTQNVRNWNNLSYGNSIHLNQKLMLVFKNVTPDEFNRARLEYHRGLEEDFFMNYEITDTLTHKIKSGESLWYLCNYVYNLPYWLVIDFNKDIDLEKLTAGDKIIIPAVKSRG